MRGVMRTMIVDDEGSARASIRALLANEPDVCVVGECRSAGESLRVVNEQRPDLLFLDVHLGGSTGLQLLERLAGTAMPIVIFVTAFETYAIPAFEHHAVDYLLKPYTDARFRIAVGHARARFHARDHERFYRSVISVAQQATADHSVPGARRTEATIAVRTGNTVTLVRAGEIEWVEADADYVRIHARGGRAFLHRSTMRDLEGRLDPAAFLRVHRSTIVRTAVVVEVRQQANAGHVVVLRDGTIRALSETGRARLAEVLGGGL